MSMNEQNAADVVETATEAKMRDIIENVDFLLDQYVAERGLESLKAATQQEYNAGLMYVRLNYFARDKKILRKYTQGGAHNGLVTDMYDDDLVYMLGEYYIYMSGSYNKIANTQGFSYLTGIEVDTLARWGGLESQRPRAYGLSKMLRSAYEAGLENGAQNGKNPVGYMAALNHRFGWSADNKPALTVNITRSKDQIMSMYGDDLPALSTGKP